MANNSSNAFASDGKIHTALLHFGSAKRLCLFCLMRLCLFCLLRQNKIHGFIWADQDWVGLMIFKSFSGSGLDRIQFLRNRIGLGLKNFTVRSSLLLATSPQGCQFQNLAFLKPDFKILAFFEDLFWHFLGIKKSQTKSVFFSLLSVGKAWIWKKHLSELRIHYKSPLKRVYPRRMHKILKGFYCYPENDRFYC